MLGLVLALVVASVAWAYWLGNGTGTGQATTKSAPAPMVVTQTASTGALAPGESVPLGGMITNPNNTDLKAGSMTASVTGVSNGASLADFSIVGGPVLVNAVVKKGTPLAWSGLTLAYANSAVSQESGKNATVSISYTLAPFAEAPATGTFTYAGNVLIVANVAMWPSSAGDMPIQAGDALYVHIPAGGFDSASDSLVVAAVNGEFNFSSAPFAYPLLHSPGQLELKRGGVYYLHSPAWMLP